MGASWTRTVHERARSAETALGWGSLTGRRGSTTFALGGDMYGFTDEHLVARVPHVNVWRADDVIGVQAHGVLDDATSDRWRAIVDDEIARQGMPRFIVIDFSKCDPQNSMAARYRTASFAREKMKRIEHCLILTGGTAGPTVVVRAVLRALGLPNLQMTVDPDEFDACIRAMRRGVRPRRTSERRAG